MKYRLLSRETYVNIPRKEVKYNGKKVQSIFRYVCHKLFAAGRCSRAYERYSGTYYTKLEITGEVLRIANQIIDMGILTPKSIDDCQHIATAVVHGCDCILSWNFKHIVNIKTIKGVRAITHLESYKDIDIMNPSVLLGGRES